jgi:hypothetical protein
MTVNYYSRVRFPIYLFHIKLLITVLHLFQFESVFKKHLILRL